MAKENLMENEIWRIVEGHPNYEVSNFGGLRNVKTKLPRRSETRKLGYQFLVLNGKGWLFHRLVARAFPDICGEWHEDYDVHHLDFNPENNRADNLKICTRQEHFLFHKDEPNFGMKGKTHTKNTREKISENRKVKCKGVEHYLYGKKKPK